MSNPPRTSRMYPPVSTARLIGELSVVLVSLAVLSIPARPHAATRGEPGCEPQPPLAAERIEAAVPPALQTR